ncbi:MAG: ABC transporter permease [Saprospiraceae bacterium]|nr:ABC transporter permease [Saprospiraceae bacterium]MDP4820733.1 ABC transporter permease [Saprospiraceae bacterium]MDP4997668.1 ABC transporter permease [Saprospiraceae bacterium]
MSLLGLSLRNILHKPLRTTLSLILFALGVGLIALLFLINSQLQEKFDKNLASIDLVIGAKGSPLQLILNSMYHIDAPTGNIPIQEAQAFLRPGHPLIETAIPLSIGDSYRAHRIVGTQPEILELYEARLAEGKMWESPMEVVVGAAAAANLDLKLGDTFNSSHGLIQDDDLIHSDAPLFKVTGILEPSGAVLDQLILTATPSVWLVHDHEEADEDHDHAAETDLAAMMQKPLHEFTDQSITSILIRFKGRNFQALNMQRNINENTNLQAATPAIEINRLYAMLGVGADALRTLAMVIVLVSGLSIFISLYASLKDRKYELALMRVMGASPAKIIALILTEGILMAVLGYLLGTGLSHLSMEVLGSRMKDAYQYSFTGFAWVQEEAWLLAGAIAIGFVAAIIPAIQAGKTDISTTLSEG